MKRYTVEQKLSAIKDYEAGTRVTEICRKYNINPNTFYKLKEKYEESGVEGLTLKVVNTITSKEAELRRKDEELKELLIQKKLEVKIYKDLKKQISS